MVKKSQKEQDSTQVNVGPIVDFLKKNKKLTAGITIALLICIGMFFAVFYRAAPASLPAAEDWARDSIISQMRAEIQTSISQDYPNLPQDRKNELINEQLEGFLQENKAGIELQVQQNANYIRTFMKNDEGQTYLLAIDPYYYWSQTENVVDHGGGYDVIIDGVKYNTHVRAPLGSEHSTTEFHPYFSAAIYKFVSIFNPNAKVFNVFFWIPAIISALSVIPAFFIARKKAGNVGGFVAGLLVGVNGVFLGRTAAGFSDTDAYNVTFPLFIFWMFLEAFEAKDWKKKVIFSTITGVLIGVYSRAWAGWWYIFDFMLVTMIAYIIYIIIKAVFNEKGLLKGLKSSETKRAGMSILGIIVSSGIFTTLFNSFNTFLDAPLSPLRITNLQNAAKTDLWPNVFTTVAELNKASLGSIVNQISTGYPIYFFLACLGLIITMIGVQKISKKDWYLIVGSILVYIVLITPKMLTKSYMTYLIVLLIPVAVGLLLLLKDKRDIDIKYALFLSIWFVGTIYASTQGVRFILLLVPAYAVSLGILVGVLYDHLKRWSVHSLKINEWWMRGSFILVILLLMIIPLNAANEIAKSEVPSMNDAWWNSLTKIKEESAPNAIINSWWDFGHWFKSIADRAVTFDGGSQNTPMAHWIGRALSTSNEHEAIGILRMLDCGSKTGFDALSMNLEEVDIIWDVNPNTTLQAHEIMNELLVENKEEAFETLTAAGLSTAEAQEVLALTHCQPPENYFITSSDMVGKSGVWAHFGLWNFKRAYLNNLIRVQDMSGAEVYPIIEELFDVDRQGASKLYNEVIVLQDENQANAWISPWPGYGNQRLVGCTEENRTVTCNLRIGLGQQQGTIVQLDEVIVDLNAPENTQLTVGFYQQGTGARVGENKDITPAGVVIGEETLERYAFEEGGMGYDIIVWKKADKYYALLADPELSTSLFTKLYYLEGSYTQHFEKFSDESDPIRGDRIIIWKVNWDGQNTE